MPNFKFYSWAFTLRSLTVWFNPTANVSWRTLEENIVHPWSLREVHLFNLPTKMCKSQFGSIISQLISTWRCVEKYVILKLNGIRTPQFLIILIYELGIDLSNSHNGQIGGSFSLVISMMKMACANVNTLNLILICRTHLFFPTYRLEPRLRHKDYQVMPKYSNIP